MKKGIAFGIGFLLILGMFFLLSLLLPSKISITKSVGVRASTTQVHRYLNDFHNWPDWFLPMEDSTLQIVVSDDGRSTSVQDDKGKAIRLEKQPATGDTLIFHLSAASSQKVEYQFILIPQTESNTQIVLNVNTYFKWYPWEKLKGIFLDKMAGPMYQKSMLRLEDQLEKNKS